MAETVTFDGNDIAEVPGLDVIGTDPHRPAPRELNINPIARADKSSVSSGFYKNRKIHVQCTIGRDNKADLQSSLRHLEALLQGREKPLVLPIAGTNTEFTATKDNIMVGVLTGGFAEIDIEFFCSNPTGYNESSTSLYSYASLTGSDYSFAITWDGNVKQQPVVTIGITSISGGTGGTITISNPTTGETLTIQRDWTAGEELIVNSKTGDVTVDGDDVEYTGNIPEWEGTEPVVYSDDFTTRDISVDIDYQVRNL